MTAGCLHAQNGIYIKMADGRTFCFSKDKIQKLSFKSEGQMQVETTDGQTHAYNIEEIKDVPMTDKAVTKPGNAVDLGLSVMWASCNIGATQPEEFGECYAWGETEEKESYTHRTYEFYDGTGYFKNIGSNISGTQYDVARAKLGGTWRMPTADELQELCDKCTWRWTSHNGVFGYLVTGPSGNSIFLPPTGYKYDTEYYEKGLRGGYWSTTIRDNTNEASGLSFPGAFSQKGYYLTNFGRHYGHFVRAVKD